MSDYAFVHNGKAFTPNQTEVEASQAEQHNAQVEAAELAYWQTRPDRMLAYYKLNTGDGPRPYLNSFRSTGTVSTWTGKPLGVITSARVYQHNLGSRMVSVRVRGNNGANYYGRASYDHGECINLRKCK